MITVRCSCEFCGNSVTREFRTSTKYFKACCDSCEPNRMNLTPLANCPICKLPFSRFSHSDGFQRNGRRWHRNCVKNKHLDDQKRIRDELTDAYVRAILANKSTLCINDFPPEIVEIKRQQIRLLRAIRKPKT